MRKFILILLSTVAFFATSGFAQDNLSTVANYTQFKRQFLDLEIENIQSIVLLPVKKFEIRNRDVILVASVFITVITVSKITSENFLTDSAYYGIIGITITGTTIFVLTNKSSSWQHHSKRKRR